ncbi:hypothetical+protein [Methylocapsa aurea]|uniref:hypothetical protein n=1 Tax=Methylocapsa aurea TaxID=663610 RepID=UPI003D18F162
MATRLLSINVWAFRATSRGEGTPFALPLPNIDCDAQGHASRGRQRVVATSYAIGPLPVPIDESRPCSCVLF